MSLPLERRTSPRCDAVKNRSSIEFATSKGRRRTEARLVNISREGALLACEKLPAVSTPVSLRMEWPVRTDWVDATVVRVEPSQQVGLRFIRGCPDDLFLAGTVGIDIAFMLQDWSNLMTPCD